MSKAEELERKYALLFPQLNERQQHLIAAFDGQRLGRGGITIVFRVTGFSRPTIIYRAIESLSQRPSPLSESGIRGPDERRWSIMTPNWSKPWKLWSTPILGAIRCPRYGGPVRVHACWPAC